jgi:hypothetical protein
MLEMQAEIIESNTLKKRFVDKLEAAKTWITATPRVSVYSISRKPPKHG